MRCGWLLIGVALGCGGGDLGDVVDAGRAAIDADAPDGGVTRDAGVDTPDAGPICEDVHTTAGAGTLGGTFRDREPHYGAAAEGHASCSHYWSEVLPDFTYRSSWGTGCHTTRRFYIDDSVTSHAGWAAAVVEAFRNWDIPTACTPHWVRTTDPALGHVIIRYSATSRCAPAGTSWYACAWSGWSITLNSAHSWGVGVDGRLDIESLVTVELAHVMHFGHSPNPRRSVSLANVGRWGSSSMSVPSANSCGFVRYTACAPGAGCAFEACPRVADGGCGNYRTLRPGDIPLAQHIAGVNPDPPHPYDDGSIPPGEAHFDLAMLAGTDAGGDTAIHSWTGGAAAFSPEPDAERWTVHGFPLDRVGDRLVSGDVDGDGRDDLVTIMPRCDGGARFHLWTRSATGFDYGGDAGALDLDGIDLDAVANRVAAGDFDGDGHADVALLEQTAGTGAVIHIALGGPGATFTDGGPWWTLDSGYDLAQVGDRLVAADVDADGDSDLVTAYQYPDGTFRFHVWISDRTALTYSGAAGWYTSGSFSLSRVGGRMVAGDFDADGRTDIAMLYGTGGASTLHAWIAGDGTFTHQTGPWTVDSGYTLANAADRMVAGDFDRDGRDDVATAYQYAAGYFRFHVWRSTGGGFTYDGPTGWWESASFDLDTVAGRFVAGRFDGT